MVEILIDRVPEALNVIQRKYKNPFVRNQYNKRYYALIENLVRGLKPETPYDYFTIEATFYMPPRRFKDYDGLVASLKPIVDGLKKSGIIFDDNYTRSGPWRVLQIADKTTETGFLVMRITPKLD